MSIFKRIFQPVNGEHQIIYVLFYTLSFTIFFLSCFFLFLYFKKSFVWRQDGWDQHLRALIYYHRYLKDFFANIFIHHTFSLPTYSMHIGLGSDIIQTLHYYVIGDPLTLPCVFIKERYMVIYYCFLVVLRLYLAGAAFSLYGFYIAKRKNENEMTYIMPIAILIGSMIYCFNGYIFYGGTRHPYFINPMIYLPLIYLGVEKILNNERPYVFILSVGLAAISSFYFFYMIVILTIIYSLVRLFAKDFKKKIAFIKHLGRLFISAVIGTALSMIILLPQLFAIIGSSRMSSHVQSNLLPNLKTFETIFGSFFTVEIIGENWTAVGVAVIAFIAVVLIFVHKGNRGLKVMFILFTCMLLSPKVSQLMNGMSYPSNRWGFGYIFILSVSFVLAFEFFFKLNTKDNKILVIVFGLVSVLLFVNEKTRLFSIAFAIVCVFLILWLVNSFHNKKKLMLLMLCLVFVNASVNAFVLYSPFGSVKYLAQMLNYSYVKKNVNNNETKALDQLHENEVVRYEASRRYASRPGNHSLLSKYSSNQYYWSLENGNLTQYRNENGVTVNPLLYCFTGFNNRTILSTLNSVKYLIADQGYEGYKKIGDYKVSDGKTYPIYQNLNALPLGYTYDQAISMKTYNKLPAEAKQEAMLQDVALNAKKGSNIALKKTSYSCPFKVVSMDGVTKKGNSYVVKKKRASMTISYTSKNEACETYLKLINAKYQSLTKKECYSQEEYNKLSAEEKVQIAFSDLHRSVKAESNIMTALYQGNKYKGGGLNKLTNEYNDYYHFIKERLINNGVTNGGQETMVIIFEKAGIYSTGDIQVIKQPLKLYKSAVKQLKQETLQNIHFNESKYARASSTMVGTIDVSKAKYLLMTIPYSQGWNAYVDGKKTKLMKGNTIYCCLRISKGHHEIKMVYHTPGMKEGAWISLISLIALAGVILFVEKKRHLQSVD